MSWAMLETWWPLFLAAGAFGALVMMRVLSIYAEREITLHETVREARQLYIAEYHRQEAQAARRRARREARGESGS